MNLKSLVNKGIIKSDLRRYWYLGALFFGMLLLTAVLPAANIVKMESYIGSDGRFVGVFDNEMSFSIFAVLIFAVITPAMVFSYLHHKSAVNVIHSMPVRREGLYASHIISVGILTVVPVILNMLIMLGIKGLYPSHALVWAGLTIVYVFVLTGFATAFAMLTANVFASITVPYVIILLPMFVETMARLLCERYLYGASSVYDMVTYKIYAGYEELLNGMMFVYIALGIILFVLGLILYKKRALENNSRLSAFNFVNPIFLYGVAICVGFFGYIYVTAFFGENGTMWIAAPFGIIGIIVARMIIERTFKPHKIIKPSIVYLAMLFVIYAFVGLDITGYEKRIPDINEVESVNVVNNEYVNKRYYQAVNDVKYATVKLAPEAIHDARLYDKGDIEKVIALHTKIVENKNNKLADNYYNFPIIYKLKNGHTIKRSYSFRMNNEMKKLYEEVMNTDAVKADRFPILSDAAMEYVSVYLNTDGDKTVNLTNEQMDVLIPALREDVSETPYKEYAKEDENYTMIYTNVIMPSVDENNKPITDKEGWATEQYGYLLRPTYKRTIALLDEWGIK